MSKYKHTDIEWKWLVDDNAWAGMSSTTRALVKNRIRKKAHKRTLHGMPGLGSHVTVEVSAIPPSSAKSYLTLRTKDTYGAEKALAILEDPTSTYIQAAVVSSRGVSIKVVQFSGSGQVFRHVQDVQHDMRLTMPDEVRAMAWNAARGFLSDKKILPKTEKTDGLSLLDTRKRVEHLTMVHTIDNTTVSVVYQGQLVAKIEMSWRVHDTGEVTCFTRVDPATSADE